MIFCCVTPDSVSSLRSLTEILYSFSQPPYCFQHIYIIYSTYYISHESMIMEKYFTSRLIYFHELEVSENKA